MPHTRRCEGKLEYDCNDFGIRPPVRAAFRCVGQFPPEPTVVCMPPFLTSSVVIDGSSRHFKPPSA